jgi:hypothetical protein
MRTLYHDAASDRNEKKYAVRVIRAGEERMGSMTQNWIVNARPRNSSVHLPQPIGQNIALTLKHTAYFVGSTRIKLDN